MPHMKFCLKGSTVTLILVKNKEKMWIVNLQKCNFALPFQRPVRSEIDLKANTWSITKIYMRTCVLWVVFSTLKTVMDSDNSNSYSLFLSSDEIAWADCESMQLLVYVSGPYNREASSKLQIQQTSPMRSSHVTEWLQIKHRVGGSYHELPYSLQTFVRLLVTSALAVLFWSWGECMKARTGVRQGYLMTSLAVSGCPGLGDEDSLWQDGRYTVVLNSILRPGQTLPMIWP